MEIVHHLHGLTSPEMEAIWKPQAKFALERRWWVQVMKEQAKFGVDIPAAAIRDYESVASEEFIDLESIAARERITRHDVKARLEEFNAQAGGWQHAHKGMTGRDLDDNVEMIQANQACKLLQSRLEAVSPSGAEHLGYEIRQQTLRGIWGPIGTGQDMIELLGDLDHLVWMNFHLSVKFGFHKFEPVPSYGQVYPRSIDYRILSTLASAIGFNLSPGWRMLINGYVRMTAELAGGQWLEGDVSCSVVRRVALADAFLAADAGLNEKLEQE